MPTPHSAWFALDLSLKMDNAEFGNTDEMIVSGIVPRDGVIRDAWYAMASPATAGTLQLHKFVSSASSINLLTTTTVAISASGVSANVASRLTLTSNKQSLKVTAGQVIRAVWTFTTVGTADGPTCQVWIEPKTW